MLRILTLAFGLGFFAYADSPRSITVTGDAEVWATPDEAELSLYVESLLPDLRKAVTENQATVKKVIAAAQTLGLKPNQIQSDRLEVDPRSGSYESSKITGYSVRRRLSLKLTDLSKLEALTLDVLTAGANRIEATQFRTESLRKSRDEARLLALKAAQEKAAALAKAAGAKLGRALDIRENVTESGFPSQAALQNVVRNSAPEPGTGGETMYLGKLSIRAKIQATFELN